MAEQLPPTVTITDPHRPGGSDVLAVEPWRPGRRTVVGLVAVLLLAVAGRVVVVQQHRNDRRAAALRAIDLAVRTVLSDGSDQDARVQVELGISNAGGTALVLRGVRLDAPDWLLQAPLPPRLGSGQEVRAGFWHLWRCPVDPPPSAVLLDVEVPGVARRTVRRELDASGTQDLAALRQGTCGDVGAARAVDLGTTSLTVGPRSLQVSLQLFNRSTAPLSVRAAGLSGTMVIGAAVSTTVVSPSGRPSPAVPTPAPGPLASSGSSLPILLRGRPAGSPAGRPSSVVLSLLVRYPRCLPLAFHRDEPLPPEPGVELVVRGRDGAVRSVVAVPGLPEALARLRAAACPQP